MFTGLIADLGSVLAIESDGDGATLRVRTALASELREGDSIAVNGVCLTATRVRAGEPLAANASAGEGWVAGTSPGEGGTEGTRPQESWAEGTRPQEGGTEGARPEESGTEGASSGEGGTEGARPQEGGTEGTKPGEFEAQAIRETLERSTLGLLSPADPVNLELALRADGRLGGHIVQGHVDGVGTVAGVREEGFSRVLTIQPDPSLLPYVAEKGSIAIDGISLTVSALRERGFEVSLIPETLERTTLGRAAAGRRVNLEVDILAKHVQRLLEAHA